MILVGFAGAPGPLSAQYLGGGDRSRSEVQLADFEQLREKLVSLTRAAPDSVLDWRPMEGVRSFREVVVLAASEGNLFPGMWGFERPRWITADGSIAGESRRLSGLPKAELADELDRAFGHTLDVLRSLEPAERERRVSFFGLGVDLETAFTLMATDLHEHLGQLIAYARIHRVVPPWSR